MHEIRTKAKPLEPTPRRSLFRTSGYGTGWFNLGVPRNGPAFPDKKSPSVEHRLVKINLLKLKCVRIRFKQPVWRDRPSLLSLGRVVHTGELPQYKLH
jgi:hypothetical protein